MNGGHRQGSLAKSRGGNPVLRGLGGFTLGGLLAFLGVYYLPPGPTGEFLRLLVLFPATGALAGAVLAGAVPGRPLPAGAACSFGVGFLVAAGSMPLAAFLQEAGILTGAATSIGFAVGFGAAGMFGAGIFSWQAAAAALVSFALGGALGGQIIARQVDVEQVEAGRLLVGFLVTYGVGGAGLGLWLATCHREGQAPDRDEPASGAAHDDAQDSAEAQHDGGPDRRDET